MAENPRTTTARDNDDSDLIDQAVADSAAGGHIDGRAGGRLQTDVGTQNDLTRDIDDPEALTRPKKDDDINNDQARRNNRPRD